MRARYDALKKHRGGCLLCKERASNGNPLNVDHIWPCAVPEWCSYSGISKFCARCNLGKGNRDATDWRPRVAASPKRKRRYTPTDDVLAEVRRLAPDRNPDELVRQYNNWCSKKMPARNPHGAFIGWVERVIKGARKLLRTADTGHLLPCRRAVAPGRAYPAPPVR